MSGFIGGWESRYKNVIFKHINMAGLIMDYPDFENCIFENCNLKKVDFCGALIHNVEFIGEVSDARFRGRYQLEGAIPPKEFDNERRYKLNPMIADFSRAIISYTLFTDGCDLTQAVLPKDGKHYLIADINKVSEFVDMFCTTLAENEKKFFKIIKNSFLRQREGEKVKILNVMDWYNSMTKDEALKEHAQIIFDKFINELETLGWIS